MRRIVGVLLVALALTLQVRVGASAITATSCNASDVQAALNRAVDGDTVSIPPGTCHWTTGLTWTAPANVVLLGAGNVSIQGGGDATVIVDDSPTGTPLLTITTNANGTFRLAAITFQGGVGAVKENGIIQMNGQSKQMRVDHLHINMQSYSPANNGKPIRFSGWLNGVMDHAIVDLSGVGEVFFAEESYGTGIDNHGDQSFAAPTNLGSRDFIFVEDSRFTGSPTFIGGVPTWASIVTDCNAGGRFVLRYNTIYSAGPGQTHPTGGAAGGRGCRAHELYGNIASPAAGFNSTTDTPGFAFSWMSSGTSVVWGNTSNGAYKQFIHLDSMRKSNETYAQTATPDGWGYCGTQFNGVGSNWDGNTDTTSGYPCLDQPGRGRSDLLTGVFPNRIDSVNGSIAWPRQASEPVYEWLNNYTAALGWGNDSSNYVMVATGASTRLAENRDYYKYNASFQGTAGVGVGPRASRPVTCTPGVAYWSTDQGGNWNTINATANDGTLDVCTAPNTWTNSVYTPFIYPHPMTQPGYSAPAPPTSVSIR